ncbi:MAG: tetratricopeptide repeat protein [Bacteroidota bacterium]
MNDNFENYNEEEINELVDKFEQKIKFNQSYFFDVEEYEMLIDYYIDNENIPYTNQLIQHAVSQHPDSIGILLKKAQLYAYADNTEKALELLAKLESMDPDNSDVFFTKGAIYSQLKRYEKAIEEYHKAITRTEELDEVYINIAFEYENLGNYEKAIEYLKKALEISPENEMVLYELAMSFDFAQRSEESIGFFQNYLNENPYSYVGWINLGTAFNSQGLNEKAIEAFDYALAIDEINSSAYYSKAATYIGMEEYVKAIDVYNEVLLLDNNFAIPYYYIGECYEKMEDFNAAIDYHTRSIKHDEYFSDAWLGRGISFYELKKIPQSINDIKKAISLNEDNAEYQLILAEILHKEKMEGASEIYKKVLKEDPSNTDAWLDYSDSFRDDGDLETAIEIISNGLKAMPKNVELYYRLAAYQLLNREVKTAYITIAVALEIDAEPLSDFFDYISELKLEAYFIEIIEQFKNDIENKNKSN